MKIGVLTLHMKEWNDHYRSSHYLMLRLAKRWPVVWIDPPHEAREAPSVTIRAVRRFRTPETDRQLHVYSPPGWLPRVYRPGALSTGLERARLQQAARRLRAADCDRIVLYCWHPQFLESTELVEHDMLVYHVVDEYSYSPEDPPTPPREREMIARADQVILHSPGLMEKKGPLAPERTAFVPNGVSYETFAASGPEPPELAGIPHPRVGYCGVLKRQMDWELICSLIDARPDLHWVFIGHWQDDHSELESVRQWLERRDNVHLTGRVPAPRLAEFPAHFDAAIMPYRVDGYTQYIYPLKLHEYLAAGTPIVGSPVRTLREFGSVLELAEGRDEWSMALDRALSPRSREASAVAARKSIAKHHDWGLLADRISELIEQRLGVEPGLQQRRRSRPATAARTRRAASIASVR
jgi:glycosyltransferase involved in cell wall biosynthesis